MRFAFLVLGPRFEPERDRAAILDGTAQIVGVPTVEQAARQAERLCREGVDCIELCGAFGEAGAVFPGAIDGVHAVAGLTAFMTPADWSSSGDHVRFSTVGEGIRSTYVPGTESPVFDPQPDTFGDDPWAMWSGTSFAAPQIAGAVARISYEQGITPAEAVAKLYEYGRPIGGFGRAMRILQGIG